MTIAELEQYFKLLIKYNINNFTYSKDGESFTVNGLSEVVETKPPVTDDEFDIEKELLTAYRDLNG